jgi:aminoglycoside phosphotransferase family enzyme/predicted kinase
MTGEEPKTRIDAALMNKSAYPEPTSRVELVQTHISYVFLTDDFVYKVKKPVNFGFLDFSTLEKRKHYCEKEVELNRRLSPDIYLGVLPVTLDNDIVTMGGKGQTIEYAVKMRRIPTENLMIRLLRENRLTREMVENVARRVAMFHSEAASSKEIDRFGSIEVIKTNTDENFAQTEKYVGKTITKSQFDAIGDFTEDYLNNRTELFNRRIAEGRIRDCHGDLHLEHICITEPIRIFDCIEFNDRFRYSDTVADIAFLAMDLDFHGRRDLSETLIDAYVKYSADKGAQDLVNFYKVYRAYVRGKVTSFRLDDPIPHEEDEVKRIAQKYFSLAASYVDQELSHTLPREQQRLIIVCGLIGTGKTTVAKEIAKMNGWEIISSDLVRKDLAGIPATRHEYTAFGKGLYSSKFTELTYKRMNEIAEELLMKGKSVVVDACYGKKYQRANVYALARATNAEFTCIELVCPEEEVKTRLTMRMHETGSTSDGRWEIFPEWKASFEKLDEFGKQEHIVVDTSTPIEESVKQVMDRMRARNRTRSKIMARE